MSNITCAACDIEHKHVVGRIVYLLSIPYKIAAALVLPLVITNDK